MDSARGKTILIVILLVANLILGAILFLRVTAEEQAVRDTELHLNAFLSSRDVTLTFSPGNEVAYPCEARIASTPPVDSNPEQLALNEELTVRGLPLFSGSSPYPLDQGLWLDGEVQVGSSQACRNLTTVLVAFCEQLEDRAVLPVTVHSATLGYRAGVVGGKYVSFTPFWRLGTDKGDFDINAMTGRVE